MKAEEMDPNWKSLFETEPEQVISENENLINEPLIVDLTKLNF